MLPDGDGFDILGKLRARPEFATLPIVLLTVKAELANIRKGLALGADGYITKPYSKNQLAEVIGRVLRHPPRFPKRYSRRMPLIYYLTAAGQEACRRK
jgi:DNA-binding response OmpR family regulator